MFLSFVIPVYNGEKYLAECLDSCLTQDIPESEFEIICVNDGSTDGSYDMIRRYQEQHGNIRLIPKKHGVGFGRNMGLFQAEGDYIWFVDQDDLVLPNSLAELRQKLIESNCDRLVFRYYEFVEALSEQERRHIADRTILPNSGAGKENNVVWSSIFKKQFLIENEVWPHSKRLGLRIGGYGSDSFFIVESKNAGAEEYVINDLPYYYYRKHGGQSINAFSDEACESRIRYAMDYPIVFKEEYEQAIREKGHADFQETMEYVVWTRICALKMQKLPRKWRKIGIQRMREAGLFPLKLPKVYTDNYSWKDCVKAKNGKGPLLSIAFYYSVNPVGLFFHNILDVRDNLEKIRNSNSFAKKIITKTLELKNKIRNH